MFEEGVFYDEGDGDFGVGFSPECVSMFEGFGEGCDEEGVTGRFSDYFAD